jgi:hypothetical protein
MTESYCGINNVPKGKHRGSMKECAEKGEIRYYGIKKVDKRLVEGVKAKKYKKLNKTQMFAKKGELRGKIKTLKDKIKSEKDESKKDKLKEEGKRLLRELKQIEETLNSGIKRSSRKSSTKSQNKKKKGSRKIQTGGGEGISFSRKIRNK